MFYPGGSMYHKHHIYLILNSICNLLSKKKEIFFVMNFPPHLLFTHTHNQQLFTPPYIYIPQQVCFSLVLIFWAKTALLLLELGSLALSPSSGYVLCTPSVQVITHCRLLALIKTNLGSITHLTINDSVLLNLFGFAINPLYLSLCATLGFCFMYGDLLMLLYLF